MQSNQKAMDPKSADKANPKKRQPPTRAKAIPQPEKKQKTIEKPVPAPAAQECAPPKPPTLAVAPVTPELKETKMNDDKQLVVAKKKIESTLAERVGRRETIVKQRVDLAITALPTQLKAVRELDMIEQIGGVDPNDDLIAAHSEAFFSSIDVSELNFSSKTVKIRAMDTEIVDVSYKLHSAKDSAFITGWLRLNSECMWPLGVYGRYITRKAGVEYKYPPDIENSKYSVCVNSTPYSTSPIVTTKDKKHNIQYLKFVETYDKVVDTFLRWAVVNYKRTKEMIPASVAKPKTNEESEFARVSRCVEWLHSHGKIRPRVCFPKAIADRIKKQQEQQNDESAAVSAAETFDEKMTYTAFTRKVFSPLKPDRELISADPEVNSLMLKVSTSVDKKRWIDPPVLFDPVRNQNVPFDQSVVNVGDLVSLKFRLHAYQHNAEWITVNLVLDAVIMCRRNSTLPEFRRDDPSVPLQELTGEEDEDEVKRVPVMRGALPSDFDMTPRALIDAELAEVRRKLQEPGLTIEDMQTGESTEREGFAFSSFAFE